MRSMSARERKARRDLMVAVFDRIARDCTNMAIPTGEIITSIEVWYNAIVAETESRNDRTVNAMAVYGE